MHTYYTQTPKRSKIVIYGGAHLKNIVSFHSLIWLDIWLIPAPYPHVTPSHRIEVKLQRATKEFQ